MLHTQFRISVSDNIPPMEALIRAYGPSYRLNVAREDWNSVRTQINVWESENAYFTHTRTTPFQLLRQKLSADTAQDRLIIIVALDTEEIFDLGGTMHRMRPGSVAIFDNMMEMFCKGVSSGQQCWFGATYAKLGISPEEVRTPIFLDPETFEARALTTQTQLVSDALLRDSRETSQLLFDALLQVLRNLLTSRTPDSSLECFRALRWRNIQAFIEDNIGQRDLNADLISERFGMSRAVVYRAFEPYGGVTAYIRERRLARIFKLLAEGADQRIRLGQVSEELGFVDSAHLSNSFRKTYGVPPSALRECFGKQVSHDSLNPLQPERNVSRLLLAA